MAYLDIAWNAEFIKIIAVLIDLLANYLEKQRTKALPDVCLCLLGCLYKNIKRRHISNWDHRCRFVNLTYMTEQFCVSVLAPWLAKIKSGRAFVLCISRSSGKRYIRKNWTLFVRQTLHHICPRWHTNQMNQLHVVQTSEFSNEKFLI